MSTPNADYVRSPDWHKGRPVVRPASGGGTLILCPVGHLCHHIRHGEWAGSIWEAKASDPTWTVECEGKLPAQIDGPGAGQ